MKLLIAILITAVLAGCTTFSYDRQGEDVNVEYNSFLRKMEQPAMAFKVVDPETGAVKEGSFNAESLDETKSADTLSGAVGDVLRAGGGVSATIPDRD